METLFSIFNQPDVISEEDWLLSPAIGGDSASAIVHSISPRLVRQTHRADGAPVLSQINFGNFDQGKVIVQGACGFPVSGVDFKIPDGEFKFPVLSLLCVVLTWTRYLLQKSKKLV